ncbi:MAG: hypothetical protein HY078_01460 [Elusimicrobia bacterium]|nr:hypothetical protein [Elusimicrobiota bacterium]
MRMPTLSAAPTLLALLALWAATQVLAAEPAAPLEQLLHLAPDAASLTPVQSPAADASPRSAPSFAALQELFRNADDPLTEADFIGSWFTGKGRAAIFGDAHDFNFLLITGKIVLTVARGRTIKTDTTLRIVGLEVGDAALAKLSTPEFVDRALNYLFGRTGSSVPVMFGEPRFEGKEVWFEARTESDGMVYYKLRKSKDHLVLRIESWPTGRVLRYVDLDRRVTAP